MNEDYRKKVALKIVYSITPENVEQIYKRNFKRYLIENSDEVEINGNVYTNSIEDQQMKRMFILTSEQNNINKTKTCNTKGGFPLTEASFIKNQLTILNDLSFIDFVQTMKYETYLNFILNKKNPPQPEPILNEKKPIQNLEKFRLICKAICSDLESNRSDKSKIQTILHENSDDLHSNVFYAVIEIKRLHYSERKDIANYYLGNAKKYKNEVTELLNEAIEQNILVRYDKNLFYKDFFGYLNYFIDEVERFTGLSESEPKQIVKSKPKRNKILITFKDNETIEKLLSELKGYFPNKEAELLKALQGEQLKEILLFPHNQNKFVEVFRRLKYNGFLLNTDTETKNWICANFQFVKKGFEEPQPFNKSSVWENLNKGKGEPTKKERICITEWLPYKSLLQLTRETENEKL